MGVVCLKVAFLKCSESPIFLLIIAVYLVYRTKWTDLYDQNTDGYGLLTTADLVYSYLSRHSPLQTWSISLPTLTTADLVYISPNRTGSSTSGVVTLTSLSKAANYLKNTTYCVLHDNTQHTYIYADIVRFSWHYLVCVTTYTLSCTVITTSSVETVIPAYIGHVNNVKT